MAGKVINMERNTVNTYKVILIYNTNTVEYLGTTTLTQEEIDSFNCDGLIAEAPNSIKIDVMGKVDKEIKELDIYKNKYNDGLSLTLIDRDSLMPVLNIDFYIHNEEVVAINEDGQPIEDDKGNTVYETDGSLDISIRKDITGRIFVSGLNKVHETNKTFFKRN